MTQSIEIDAVIELNDVLEQMIYLCEIRGELDDEANARTEIKLSSLTARYNVLQAQIAPVDQKSISV